MASVKVVLTYQDYAALPHYWTVDPERRVIEVFRLATGVYDVPETFGDDNLTNMPPFEGLRLDPRSLWFH